MFVGVLDFSGHNFSVGYLADLQPVLMFFINYFLVDIKGSH